MNTKTDAQRNAEAKARRIEGLIAALNIDFDRLEELRDAKHNHARFIVGFNLAGYMPDNTPEDAATFPEAVSTLTAILTEHSNDAYETGVLGDETEGFCERISRAIHTVEQWQEREGVAYAVTIRNVEYWIKPNPEGFEDQDELNELESIVAAAELDPSQCTDDGLSEAIHELPLEVSFRSGWHSYGEELEAVEVRVLLTYGGPSCEIRADWDANRGCSSPRIVWAEMGARGELYDFDHDAVIRFVDYLCGV